VGVIVVSVVEQKGGVVETNVQCYEYSDGVDGDVGQQARNGDPALGGQRVRHWLIDESHDEVFYKTLLMME